MRKNALIYLIGCLFILAVSAPASAQHSLLWGNLETGPYSIGFRIIYTFDKSRVYVTEPGRYPEKKAQYGPRPLQIAVWYPADAEARSPKMSLGDYVDLYLSEDGRIDIPEAEKAENRESWAKYFSGKAKRPDRSEEILGTLTNASMNSPSTQGSFPLIVYGAGAEGEAFENFVLCEFLASHGYIVVASPSVGGYSHKMSSSDAMGLEAQARDMEFIIAQTDSFPKADPDRLGLMGWSWGGLASMIVQTRNPRINAVLTLDGSISFHEEKARQLISFDESKMTAAYMLMTATESFEPTQLFYDRIKYSNAYLLGFDALQHTDFSSYNFIKRITTTRSEDAADRDGKSGYEIICKFALHFFNAHLKLDNSSKDYLSDNEGQDPSASGFTYEFKKARTLPPDQSEFFAIIEQEGVQKAQKIYMDFKAKDSGYDFFKEWDMIVFAYKLFNRLDRKEDAIEAMKLNMLEHPNSYLSHGHLGRLYQKNNDWGNAINHFSIAYGMALKESEHSEKKPVKDMEWYRRSVESIKSKLQ